MYFIGLKEILLNVIRIWVNEIENYNNFVYNIN